MPVISGYSKITQLPAGTTPLAGTELLEMVQGGVSVKMPVTAFPAVTPGFILIANQPALPNSRTITPGLGVTFQDTGPNGTLTINALGGVNFGPPTALVGLAAITGVAPTVMASDSAPALNQGIAPTWTGAHVWTNAAGIKVSNTQPILELLESDGAANNQRWRVRAQGEQLLFSALSDDGLTTNNAIVIDRTNAVIDSVNLTATVAQVNGQNIRDAAILTSGTVATARLGSGTADATSFLRGDQTWQLATSIFAGFANPSASVGLAAVNGTATTAMRSDAAPALSVAIVPTWTGQHTWTQDLLGPNGALTTPTFAFSGDPNTGMYNVGADNLGFQSGGTLRLNISTTQIVSTLVSVGPNGTAPLPAYSFSGDPNTGMYNVGADDLGFATNGVLRLDISTTNVTSTLPWLGADGLVGTPGLSFSADPNTGIRRIGTDNLSLVTGGVDRLSIGSTGSVTIATPTSGTSLLVNVLQTSNIRFQGPNTGVGFYLDFFDTTNTLARGYIGIGTGTASGAAVTDLVISPGPAGRLVIGTANGVGIGSAFDATGHFLASDGSAPLPGMSFLADTDTGVYRLNTNNLGIACGGVVIADFRALGLVMDLGQFLALDGAIGTPGISFGNEQNSGLWREAAQTVAMIVAANRSCQYGPNWFRIEDGSLANNGLGFRADAGTGLYRRGAGQLGVSCGGVASVAFNGSTTTGASTPTLSANKPGANAGTIAWCPVITTAGAQGWIPIFGN